MTVTCLDYIYFSSRIPTGGTVLIAQLIDHQDAEQRSPFLFPEQNPERVGASVPAWNQNGQSVNPDYVCAMENGE